MIIAEKYRQINQVITQEREDIFVTWTVIQTFVNIVCQKKNIIDLGLVCYQLNGI